MTQLITHMLKPWPEHRPSAEAVQQEVTLWQVALSPVLDTMTLRGKHAYPFGEQMSFEVVCAGKGLLHGVHDLSWIQPYVGSDLDHAVEKRVVDELTSLPSYTNVTVALDLTGLKQGTHVLRVEALVGGVLHEAQHEFQVEMSAQQLWDAGKHEQALQHELRPAWLEQQLAGLTSVSTAYAFMQMLERLKTAHPSQTDTLEAFRQRADQQFAAKSPTPKPASVTGEKRAVAKSEPVTLFEKPQPVRDAVKPAKPKQIRMRMIGAVILLAVLGGTSWMTMLHKADSVEAALLAKLRSSEATERVEAYAQLATLAGDASNSNAQQWMGYRYLMGDGVEKDLQLAKTWYKKAKDGGSRSATTQLAEIDKALTAPVSVPAAPK
jgi:hypothetical protein